MAGDLKRPWGDGGIHQRAQWDKGLEDRFYTRRARVPDEVFNVLTHDVSIIFLSIFLTSAIHQKGKKMRATVST